MKRAFCAFFLLLFLLSGCSLSKDADTSVSFCYPRRTVIYGTEDSVAVWEEREITGSSNDLSSMLALYLQGPEDTTLKAPLPAGVRLAEASWNQENLILVFSEEITALEGIDLSIAGACISATCFSLTDAQKVSILSEDETVLFSAQREDSFLFFDTIPANTTASPEPQ